MSGALESISDEDALANVARICRDRWALVKALVLGQSPATIEREGLLAAAHYNGMIGTRDAVFTALCDMARAEEASWRAACAILPVVKYASSDMQVHDPKQDSPSRHWLMAYVEHLIERVGAL